MYKNTQNYLDLLNSKQKKAVINTNGSYLILAGAGSGKTRVLTYRLLHIISQKKATPSQILSVTFTNKAALEMKTRVSKMTTYPTDSLWIGTFHSMSTRILRKNHKLVGLKNNFIILDKDDQLKIIKRICENENIDIKDTTPKYFLNKIDRFKNKLITHDNTEFEKNKKNHKQIFKVYQIYENELLRLNSVDFGNLILLCIKIFNQYPEILKLYQNKFKYILVDEYQDINLAQQIWLKHLYQKHKNICCVGDDDQSIYSWRGADISNILNFRKVFLNPKILRLEQNYRSTQNILKCASSLISNNEGRYGKKLWSNNNAGEKIHIRGFFETKEEAIYISDEIEKLANSKISLSEIAILFRVAAHTRSFEERFLNIGLPYKIIGGLRFYERKEIKDLIAYLRIVNNLNDDLAFERIINVPKRGIGQVTIKKIHSIARLYNLSLLDAAKKFILEHSSKTKIEINNLLSKIYKWHKIKNEIHHEELTNIILEDSKYLEFLQNEAENLKNPESLNRIENINEFIEGLKEFENLDGFLEHVSLIMENIKNTNIQSVNLMTIHSAKGLEFDYVFLSGWEENVFPSKKSIEELGNAGLEEERRLAYVALTRTKKKLQITYVNQNRYSYATHDFNTPSRFIDELPKDLIDIKDTNYFENNDFVDNFKNNIEKFNSILTPGRKRLINKKKNEDIEWDFNQDNEGIYQINIGTKIYNKKYGFGKIVSVQGNVAEVKFDKNSVKKIFIKYLEPINE